MKTLDLFSGIGGFSLGLERTGGFETVAFCEIDPFCRRVLAKHWPKVPCYDDVRDLTAARLAADGIAVDIICGGFPCQDVSFAGKRAGLEGARSGLWGEYGRIIGEVQPQFVIVENVPGLLSLGMGTVLGDLSALGFDAVWDCVPACAVGAPHRRDRVWLIAYANDGDVRRLRRQSGLREPGRQPQRAPGKRAPQARASWNGADAPPMQRPTVVGRQPHRDHGGAEVLADADLQGLEVGQSFAGYDGQERQAVIGNGWWRTEPDVGRVAHGVPSRVDRLRSLGNAVVPQIPEMIGRAILEAVA